MTAQPVAMQATAMNEPAKTLAPTQGTPADRLSESQLIDMYYKMLLARKLDERMWVLNRQGKAPFHISGMGHEAIQVGAAFAMRKGHDWLHPYYRDLAFSLALGMEPRELMFALFGKRDDPTSGGRQMPAHYGKADLRIVTGSSPVATQIPQACGIALASQIKGEDCVTVTCFGEGSTSQGDFHEGLNWASVFKLPVVFLCENNQYAISEPTSRQMAVANVADRAVAYAMPGVIVDGNDVLASYTVMVEAIERARRGAGPTLVEAKTYRPVPHSSSDDDRSYRSREEVEAWKRKDPIVRCEAFLVERGLLPADLKMRIAKEVTNAVDDATICAEQALYPDAKEALGPVWGGFNC